MSTPDSQRYPLKHFLFKYELDIKVYNFENWLFSILYKSDLRISNARKHILELSELSFWTLEKRQYHLHYWSGEGSRVPMWIGHRNERSSFNPNFISLRVRKINIRTLTYFRKPTNICLFPLCKKNLDMEQNIYRPDRNKTNSFKRFFTICQSKICIVL